jgi:O-antigen/teichoic acid export membrane protein
MSHVRTVVRNAVSNWANLATSLLISFFLAPFILHKVGNTYFGVWALVSQVTGYLWLLDFGVRESVIKYVAEYHGREDLGSLDRVITASLRLYSLIGAACVLASFSLALLFPLIFEVSPDATPTAQALVVITGLDVSQAFVFNVFLGILMGLQRYDVFSKASIALSVLRAVATVALLRRGYGIVSISVVQLLSNSLLNLVVYAVSRRLLSFRVRWGALRGGGPVYRMLVSYGFFVFVNNVGAQAIFYSGNFIIAMFLPVSQVTFYAIAANLIEYMRKLISAGTQTFNPLTSHLDAKGEGAKIAMVLVKGSKFSLLLGLPVALVYLILGRQFVGLWMGREYSVLTGNVLAVLAVMTIFSLPHLTVTGILLGLNRHRIMAACRICEGIANVCLSVVLVKRLGLIGVALGSAIPHLVVVVFALPVIITRIVQIPLGQYVSQAYCRAFASAVPFGVGCLLAASSRAPSSLLGLFVELLCLLPLYVVSVWFVALTDEERGMGRRLFAQVASVVGGH